MFPIYVYNTSLVSCCTKRWTTSKFGVKITVQAATTSVHIIESFALRPIFTWRGIRMIFFFKLSFTLWELLVACYLDMKHIRMGPFLPWNAGYPAIHFASYLLAKEYSYYAFWVSGTDCLIDKKKNPSFMPLHITSNRTNSFHWSYHDGSTYNCIVCSGFLARLFEKTHASILCGLGLGQYSESGLTLK